MNPVSKSAVQRALVNVTKSERAAVSVSADFPEVDWSMLDFYGWRDPKFPQRGYVVRQLQDSLIALAVSTSGAGLAPGRKAMCMICHAVDNSSAVKLFTARRTGAAGRAGNTVGTYICADLDCSKQLRDPVTRVGRSRLDKRLDIEDIAAQMLVRLDAFLAAVRAD